MPVQREHIFQSWVDRFIDRVVLPPMFCTSIDHASATTDNARSRARARGVKSGIYDIYVCQAPQRSVWLELKARGGMISDAQTAVGVALRNCGIENAVCWSIQDVADALRRAGFKLHGNLAGYITEYQVRVDSSISAAEAKAVTRQSRAPRSPQRKRTTAADRLKFDIYQKYLP